MNKLIITEEERSRILGMYQNVIRKESIFENFKAPGTGIVYKLNFKSVDDFNKFTAQSSVTGENPYAKKIGFFAGDAESSSGLFIQNIWQALAFTGKNPLKFAWNNFMMIQSLINEASSGLRVLPGYTQAQEFATKKEWTTPIDPKNPNYTIWNSFYDMYIKPDINSRATLIAQPTQPTK
jgi:hypothetical protein